MFDRFGVWQVTLISDMKIVEVLLNRIIKGILFWYKQIQTNLKVH